MRRNSENKIFLPNLILIFLSFGVILFSIYNIVSLTLIKRDNVSVFDSYENEYYVIGKDPIDLQIEVFKQLSEELKSEERDYKKIANLVAQSFAIDFFNWSNKDAPYEVGGLQYIYDPSTFNKVAHYEYYQKFDVFKSSYGKENLPKIKSINSYTSKIEDYLIDEKAYETYQSNIRLAYEDSKGLNTSNFVDECEIIMINDNGKMKIIEVNMIDEVDLYE